MAARVDGVKIFPAASAVSTSAISSNTGRITLPSALSRNPSGSSRPTSIAHLDRVFEETLKSIETIGYPGLGHPRLQLEPDLNPEALMRASTGARVHYALDGATATLPDRYNGLGFKNLIYIVVELLDLHKQWLATPA